MIVRVVVTGRGYDAAEAIPAQLTLSQGASLDEALQAIGAHLVNGHRLSGSSLIAVSGRHLGTLQSHRPHVLAEGDELLIVAPVAGG
jgi:molybdopterin converting factor small subunit